MKIDELGQMLPRLNDSTEEEYDLGDVPKSKEK
jgi:hypothetical protein